MRMCARAVALYCAVLALAGAASAYTVDCNHEYTDCDSELSKIADEDDLPTLNSSIPEEQIATPTTTTTTPLPIPETSTNTTTEKYTEITTEKRTTEHIETFEVLEEIKPKPRLLNVDELQNFANALHNQTNKNSKKLTDLSDVTLDDDEDEVPRMKEHNAHPHKSITDKFYSNLQAPFHPLMSNVESGEETCKENGVGYKLNDKIERGCDEVCECTASGIFECSPRCKHPYIRHGRQLDDPLCFESPVDMCCSIVACATGNGDQKPSKLEMCKYNNDTYPVGSQWYIGCETTCSCEANSIVTCMPRCKRLPPSDKCINVQDPNDACCEVQVCDVSQDAHELPENVTSTSSTTSQPRNIEDPDVNGSDSGVKPLVLTEPIGSIKVLQNNSVQVNLMHVNSSDDPIHLLLSDDGGKTFQKVDLDYSNLILNLQGGKDYILKTKETGTKFNFTITASDSQPLVNEVEDRENVSKIGCWEDGKLYEVGEEFRIGCFELCECTGPDKRECVPLECPNHVGLEIMSKGCVKWAPSPPAQPPNCCPRSARCLSDGTCHYNGVPVPNWSEVPISLTGCELRCFCENGDLDCQEVCSPLPPVPPQTLRCPPLHRPAAVNISDEDCCKKWGCVPNAGQNGSQSHSMPVLGDSTNYVTPISPILPTVAFEVPPTSLVTVPDNFYKHLNPFKFSKIFKTITPVTLNKNDHTESYSSDDASYNTFPFIPIKPLPNLASNKIYWAQTNNPSKEKTGDCDSKTHTVISQTAHSHPSKHVNLLTSDDKFHNVLHPPRVKSNQLDGYWDHHKLLPEPEYFKKSASSVVNKVKYFIPIHDNIALPSGIYDKVYSETRPDVDDTPMKIFFEPTFINKSDYIMSRPSSNPENFLPNLKLKDQTVNLPEKHVTVLKKPDERQEPFWDEDTKMHVLTKQPNPYETVLLRAVERPIKSERISTGSQKLNLQIPSKSHSAMDLEHFLNQMEIQSEVNRNLERSADKHQGTAAGHNPEMPSVFPPIKPQNPPFLPTIPPEIHFPQEDIPDYDQNNIHRPPPRGQPELPDLPPGLQVPPSFGDFNKKLTVITIESDSATSIKMLLGLPPVLVGLKGSVDLRYTDKADEDISHWYSQVFAPADEILTTPRLEFRLTGLQPGTIYKVRGKLFLHNLPVSPESETYTVRTQDLPTAVEEKRREIDSSLTVTEVNDTAARVSWRHFNEDELQYIDGIQVRYRPVGTPIYSMTELLHHSRSAAELHDLRPGSKYEASLVLIPPPRATTELHDPGKIEFTTAPYIDLYNWSVIIEVRSIGAEAAELVWSGVPSPAERWVRVYRAAHACGDGQGKEHDEFKLAARDQPPSVKLRGLDPDSRCRVWLELFLTNGKVKTSNVVEINTKPLDTDNPIDNEIEASSQSGSGRARPRGDYYTALVGVGVMAALGALTSLLLLLVVVRRHRPRSVPITPVPSAPRESSLPPYDNPAYKLELQQETMDL